MKYITYWMLGLLVAVSFLILGVTWGYSNLESNPLMVGVVMWGGVILTSILMFLTIIDYNNRMFQQKDSK